MAQRGQQGQGYNPDNIDFQNAQVAFDEAGQPFIILREQQRSSRVRGLAAHKANIQAAKAVNSLILHFYRFCIYFILCDGLGWPHHAFFSRSHRHGQNACKLRHGSYGHK
jgi:hypothetical protein